MSDKRKSVKGKIDRPGTKVNEKAGSKKLVRGENKCSKFMAEDSRKFLLTLPLLNTS